MRIDALQLIAFGPFTSTVFDLSAGRQGFHLVYGPNEAGKSSALRALRQLLYGIPERSDDNFLHPYTKMRIGAVLKTAGGKTLEIIRRKGRAGTLRTADDTTVVEETELQQLLQGVDADLFATMFGISHQDLVQGGKDIIQGGGDVGRLVFSAGSGIANLRGVQAELQEQADQLFRPSGQKPAINESLNLLKSNQKQLREAQLTGQEWARHDEALRSAETRKQAVDADLAHLQKARSRLQRIDEALPLIARRRELADELSRYAGAVLLPPDFADKRRQFQIELGSAAGHKTQAEKSLESLSQEIAALDPTPALLENTELIEELHRELGSQRKAATDRISLDSRRKTLLGEAGEILRNLRNDLTLEQAESLRIQKTEALRIQKLSTTYERIHTRLEDARNRLPELDREIDAIDDSLAALDKPRAIESLRAALAEAGEYGPLEKHHRTEQVEIDSAAGTIAFDQGRLKLEAKPLEALERLAVPPLETIRVFEEKIDSAARRQDDIITETQKAQTALADVQRQIQANRLEQEVPTEEDLQQTRALRDSGWQLIAATLAGLTPAAEQIREFIATVPGAQTLAEAFAAAVAKADAVSDRLRREADRVVAKARLLADQAVLQDRLRQMESDRQAAAADRTALVTEWAALWQPTGITPRTPREMAQWVRDFHGLTAKIRDLRSRRAKADSLGGDIDTRRQTLTECLQAMGGPEPGPAESLTGLIKRAEAEIAAEQELLQTRSRLEHDKHRKEKDRATASERLASTEAELRQWQRQWEAAVAPIGLDASAHPDQAGAIMEDLKSLFDKIKETGILQKRIEGIDQDADHFIGKVSGLARVVSPDLSRRPSDEAVLELHQRLKRARDAAAKKAALQKQLAQEENRLSQAEADIARIEAGLKAMCAEAGCKNPDELAGAEQRSERRRAIETGLQNTDDQLRRLSAGATVEDFIQGAAAVDPDAITGEIAHLESSIERLEREKSELDQSIGSERTELSKMDGTSRASILAEEIQIGLGRLENHVAHYARLKIAAKVLAMAVERYRDKSQGPILTRASELFRRITGGSFEGLRAEFDDAGRPVIVGARPGSADLVTEEGMSDGTADQLYLALRLAGLEMYLKKNEPLPFVVDDILIMFDNDRAAATLKVLAELSEKTQVIFFTHHRHLVELAENHIDPALLIEHTLNA